MIRNEELIQCLIGYGRETMQDFVTKSRNIHDAIYYLRLERCLEILKLTSFVTRNLINFERRTTFPYDIHQGLQESGIGWSFNLENLH
jgi:hypothetical protein